MANTRVAYVFPNSRREMIAEWRAGAAPDTHLLGLNHLAPFGIEAEARDARVVFVVLRRNLEGIDVPPNVEVRERIPYSDLGAAISRVLDDGELADALGRASRRRAEEQHTMADMAARLAPLVKAAAA